MQIQELKNDVILDKNCKYFDFTASALALNSIEKQMQELLKFYANIHSDSAKHSKLMAKMYKEAKDYLRQSLKIKNDYSIIACGFGSSAAIKKFQELLGIYISPAVKEQYFVNIDYEKLPLVIVGAMEHHSNEISYRQGLCKTHRLSLREQNNDLFELERICKRNKGKKIIISISAASNITGIRANLEEISKIAKKYNAILAVDASACIAYENINCDYDAMFFSGHKVLGGVGTCGILVIRNSLIKNEASFAAGGTVKYVSKSKIEFIENKEDLEEGGTPAITQVIKLAKAFKIRDEISLNVIANKEKELLTYFFSKINPYIYKYFIDIYAQNEKNRIAIISLNVANISPYVLAECLSNDFGIESRAGCACAGPYAHDLMHYVDGQNFYNKPGFLRLSLHYLHEKEDIDYLINALISSIKKIKGE
ncbi:aminotransferase class V-fold PLP-dependent enzyme [Campylobacter canadensis]|uniref:Aminotransferase class V-fold PLP-dependent enzyme n=1 Tax=Campylobacter canadensis TaxID=449520 RepID=A0ABS7WQA3_9BACT|nr:aminotransferase class V-fold PLP-dependent enzyme [Campylobacter canadensis]MBZ7986956.1 aminotransferase class V-fold PLP-dependent enzyme [Campylobacter canadensis]MBZ7994275.1 aminotransferase class V-fold PLP-dependent enzyme [Campylobacter canadensis]MBZ7995733.1 aminotransferase class V-fold PLP-dependent enzyme [Campylobacter canadensis]MBZ7997992.1 aminotransferase class V-fold PLP-dependent enzyme [Campylobacter canadensis]MBZ7999607.1 aminotransferase class V-fold PLP-dependent e